MLFINFNFEEMSKKLLLFACILASADCQLFSCFVISLRSQDRFCFSSMRKLSQQLNDFT